MKTQINTEKHMKHRKTQKNTRSSEGLLSRLERKRQGQSVYR